MRRMMICGRVAIAVPEARAKRLFWRFNDLARELAEAKDLNGCRCRHVHALPRHWALSDR
ncbi:protein of unknown function [Paraburkholderia dioscoreae]|uniref:Uncharacterized protein n=1 Tax=Paraburkholderia dioscoreae TaxID=2604047 RepID=A0A5Q4ZNR6_9BURK|nr:protein of unknown function [Paraburkholderia dioscoreae]